MTATTIAADVESYLAATHGSVATFLEDRNEAQPSHGAAGGIQTVSAMTMSFDHWNVRPENAEASRSLLTCFTKFEGHTCITWSSNNKQSIASS